MLRDLHLEGGNQVLDQVTDAFYVKNAEANKIHRSRDAIGAHSQRDLLEAIVAAPVVGKRAEAALAEVEDGRPTRS